MVESESDCTSTESEGGGKKKIYQRRAEIKLRPGNKAFPELKQDENNNNNNNNNGGDDSSAGSERENYIRLNKKEDKEVEGKRKKKSKNVHFANESDKKVIAPVDEVDCVPVSSDDESSISALGETTNLVLNSTLVPGDNNPSDDTQMISSLRRTQYIDVAPAVDNMNSEEVSPLYEQQESTEYHNQYSAEYSNPDSGMDRTIQQVDNTYITMHGGLTTSQVTDRPDEHTNKTMDVPTHESGPVKTQLAKGGLVGAIGNEAANESKLSKRTVNDITFDTTYETIQNDQSALHLGQPGQHNESDMSNVYGNLQKKEESNYGVADTSILEKVPKSRYSLPRTEITLLLVNIGCSETLSQDFQDLIKDVNNVQVLGQFFVVSRIRVENCEESTSSGFMFSMKSTENLYMMAFYEATNVDEERLKLMRSKFEKLKLPREHILLCGVSSDGVQVEENFDVGLFSLKNKMLHRVCPLTFDSVSTCLNWAIRLRLDSTSGITLVPSRSNPGSPIVNKLVSDKHFDSTSLDSSATIDLSFSICLIGPPQSGKSKIIERFMNNSYTELYQKTIGADFHQKSVRLNRRNLKLQFWDCGKGFETVVEDHLNSARCVIAVFDHTSRSSLQSLFEIIHDYSEVIMNKVLVIAGTKSDLTETDIRDAGVIQALTEKYKAIGWFPVSSKTGDGIENMLVDCCIMATQNEKFESSDQSQKHPRRRSLPEVSTQKRSSTCTII